MKAIEVRDLRKSYGPTRAVDGVSFAVDRGEVFGLLGPNGAGKTTTIEILEGYRRPDGGEVRVCGLEPASDGRAYRERIGMMLQNIDLYPELRVKEILSLFRCYYSRHLELGPLVDQLGLSEKMGSPFSELSSGQKRKVGFVLSLINDPEVIFLDEPTAGLDAQSRRRLWEMVREFSGRGAAVLLTTHYIEEAQNACDRVGIIDRGRLVAVQDPRNLMADFASNHRIEFLADGDMGELSGMEGVDAMETPETGQYVLHSRNPQTVLKQLIAFAEERGIALRDLRVEGATLEDVFIQLTGSEVRE